MHAILLILSYKYDERKMNDTRYERVGVISPPSP